jgi:hypothetical protein
VLWRRASPVIYGRVGQLSAIILPAYRQPDGDKRTSRLTPLLLYNCAPLSFLDVEQSDYACATLGVYEQRGGALAVEFFETSYRRSIEKYRAALSAFTPFFVIFPADMSVSFCPTRCDGRVP